MPSSIQAKTQETEQINNYIESLCLRMTEQALGGIG